MPPIDLTRDASLTYDVVTIGNALVDVIAAVEDRFLVDEDVVKGSMTLVDANRSAHLFSRITDPTQTSGGSAANTAYGRAWAYVVAAIITGLVFYLIVVAVERWTTPWTGRTRSA